MNVSAAELEKLAQQLSRDERLWLIERLASGLRSYPQYSPEELDAQMEVMVNDPDMQRVLRGEDEYDLTGVDPKFLPPRGPECDAAKSTS
jgi:hypothetical protein